MQAVRRLTRSQFLAGLMQQESIAFWFKESVPVAEARLCDIEYLSCHNGHPLANIDCAATYKEILVIGQLPIVIPHLCARWKIRSILSDGIMRSGRQTKADGTSRMVRCHYMRDDDPRFVDVARSRLYQEIVNCINRERLFDHET